MKTIETVKAIYQAFGRGDVPAILEHVSDDVDWEYGSVDAGVPWLQRRRGREGVAEFFRSLAAIEMTRFEIHDIVGDERVVVGLVGLELTVKATGKRVVEADEAHIWRFDDRGRVVRFRHAADTFAHAAALE